MTRGSGTNEQQSTTDRTQGKVMDKWKLTGSGALIALSALAAAIAYHHPIAVRVAVPGPFATDRLSDEAQVALGDGRTLTLGSGVLSLGDKHIALTTPRHFASLTAMPTGQVLIWGGVDNEGRLVETGEWFEPSTGALVTTGRLGLPVRAAHTLSVLSDGSLAMTGGWGPGNVPAHEVAVWRPLDRSLSVEPGDTAHARLGGEAVLLADGTLRVTGGIDEVGRPVHDAWQFGTPERHDAGTPGIAASYPLKDARSASPIGPLALRFDEPIDAAQLNGTVSLLGPNGVVKTRVVGAENGRLAFIQLPDELYPSARYTIFVQGLHTAGGKPVPYEAIGFTTRAARNGVVLAGEGKRPGTDVAKPTEPAVYVMAGEGKATPCKPGDAFHLCRDKGEVKDGAFYPGQDNVATASGGHWRLYKDRQSLPDTKQLEANLPKGATALIGQVRRIDDTPVANVAITIGEQTVQTDAHGVFVLQNLQSGRRELFVDGGPAGKPGTEYGRFIVGADIAAATVNHMPFVMYLPRVLERDKIPLPSPTTRETVLTHPDMPGLELRIPAGAVFKDRNGKVLNEIAIVPTPVDHAPFPLPDNFPMYFTIQPGDAVVQGMTPEAAKGIQVVYPNYGKQKPADKADFWVYSAEKGWEMYGAGHVSSDASQLVADKDTRLVWALGAGASTNPPPPNGPKRPDNACAGEPVDLASGMFFHRWQDLVVDDVIPLVLERTSNGIRDYTSPFGIGSGASHSIVLSSADGFSTPSIVLSCGEMVRYELAAGKAEWPLTGTVWRHTGTNSSYYGSTLQFLNDSTPEGAHWVLTLVDGGQYWFERHAPNRLVRYQDRFGNAVTYTYDSGLLSRITSPNGRTISFTYNSNNHINAAVDNIGRKVTYSYQLSVGNVGNQSGQMLTDVTYPDNTTEHYTYATYAPNGIEIQTLNIKSMTNRRGLVWVKNEYDGWGQRVLKQTYADGSSLQFAYTERPDFSVEKTTVTDEAGNKRVVTFDPGSGYPTKDTLAVGTPLEESWSYSRDGSGLLLGVTDPVGRRTTYSRDGTGRVLAMTQLAGTPDASTYSMTYTADFHQVASTTDPSGNTAKFGYTEGCLTSITDAEGNVTRMQCDASGQLSTMADPTGRKVVMVYKGGDLVSTVNADGRVDSFTYDAVGRRLAHLDPSGSTSLWAYDVNDQIVATTSGGGERTSVEYDGSGSPTKITLPNGGTVQYEYDNRDRVTKRIDQDGVIETWEYDPRGLLAVYTDKKGQKDVYDHDALGRTTLISYADGSGVSASYDAAGRQTELLDTAGGAIRWTYDELNRVTTESTSSGDVAYEYDANDRVIAMTPSKGLRVTYEYDRTGKVTRQEAGGLSTRFSYDAAGRRSAIDLPNGVAIGRNYEVNGRLSALSLRNRSGTSIGEAKYSYDASGRIASEQGSLHSVLLANASIRDSVFGLANRQSERDGIASKYDANGNLKSDGALSLEWDARDRLVSVQSASGQKTTYKYDALGRRIARDDGLLSTSYLYDGDAPAAQITSDSDEVTTLLHGPAQGETVARISASGSSYLVPDALGSTVALLDENGDISGGYAYDVYGSSVSEGDVRGNDIKFAGLIDDDNGLYYNNARYYQPKSARFVSADPIGLNGGINDYAYVDGDPVNNVDPSGYALTSVDWTCMRDPQFCAELFGDIVHASADIQRKLGNDCAAVGLDALGDLTESVEQMAAMMPSLSNIEKGIARREANAVGRQGRMARLRELMNDDKLGSADRGWLKQEFNAMKRDRKQRPSIRLPPGKELAHEHGREAEKGFSYAHSNLQDKMLHAIQHALDNFGRNNNIRPVK
jgi:RHS repeat-associated protein